MYVCMYISVNFEDNKRDIYFFVKKKQKHLLHKYSSDRILNIYLSNFSNKIFLKRFKFGSLQEQCAFGKRSEFFTERNMGAVESWEVLSNFKFSPGNYYYFQDLTLRKQVLNKYQSTEVVYSKQLITICFSKVSELNYIPRKKRSIFF